MLDQTEKEELKQRFYAESPWDLVSLDDDKYRDAVDRVINKL